MVKILYVEDNEDTAEAVKIILESSGFKVDLAIDGNTALEMVKKDLYDIFLLDVMLPDMSGWDIFEKIKGKKDVKYAFISAIPVSEERIKELRKSGVSDYIMKPFTRDDLVKRVRKMLAKK